MTSLNPNAPEELRATQTRLPKSFKALLIGESLSLFGGQIAFISIPLIAVLSLGSGELAVGLLSAFGWLPIVLFGLFAGTIVDRSSRWLIMATCNAIRGILVSTIPLLALFNSLSLVALL